MNILVHILLLLLAPSQVPDIDYDNSWKLYKIEDKGVEQSYHADCTLFYDPKGNYGCYIETDLEIYINGTWSKKGKTLTLKLGNDVAYRIIQSWSNKEIILSPDNNPDRKYFYKK